MHKKQIIIKQIENSKDRYIAYHKDDFLQAGFWVCFNDTITGAVALSHFAHMIQTCFNIKNTNFVIADSTIQFKNPALLDEIMGRKGAVA